MLVAWCAAFAALLAGFRWNAWRAVSAATFATTQRDTEGLVFGRLAAARAQGFFAHGALLGFAGDRREDVITYDSDVLWRSYAPEAQRWLYLNATPYRSFGPYFTHNGLQGSAFVLADRLLGFLPRTTRAALFATLTAALVAALYATLATFLWRELGTGAGLGALLAAGASPWLTSFAPNLYFSIWLYGLPGLALGLALRRPGHPRERRRLALAAFLGFLPRHLAGPEFLTATAALAAASILYFSLRDRVGWRTLLARTLVAGAAGVLALLFSLALLFVQIRAVTGSFDSAREHLQFSWARRAGGDPSELPAVYASALATELSTVLAFYCHDPFDREAADKPPLVAWLLARSHAQLGLATLAAALWLVLRTRRAAAEVRQRARALLAATAAAFLGVLAWLVVFKAHSALHPHVNPLLWHLGFLALGAALVGWVLEDALRALVRRVRPCG